MTIVQINSVPNKSTGNIMQMIHHFAKNEGWNSYCFYGRGVSSVDKNIQRTSYYIETYAHVLATRLMDYHARCSIFSTKRLIHKLKKIKPDVLHIHNIHGYYLNLEMLVDYINKENIKTVWTLHDCWLFTGHCAYFDMLGCSKWEHNCYDCAQKSAYPKTYFSRAKSNYNFKKRILSELKNATFISPSIWLKKLFKRSFLSNQPIRVINNGIDLDVFKESDNLDIRRQLGLSSKDFILLCVAADFSDKRKGFADILKLAKIIPTNMKIIVVGANKKQIASLPKNVIGLGKTDSIKDLVSIYSVADIFINTTYEDNYPTVNLEALACSLPVISYATGGCIEQITYGCGYIVDKGDLTALASAVLKVFELGKDSFKENCVRYSKLHADMNKKYTEYIELYQELMSTGK